MIKKNIKYTLLMVLVPLVVFGGMNDRFSNINLKEANYVELPEISAPVGTPASNTAWFYCKDSSGVSNLYFENDAGTVFNLSAPSFAGNVDIAGTLEVTGVVTSAGGIAIDDGVTDSPALTFQDATNETSVFIKSDGAFLGLTTEATDGLNVLVGNLKIGDGTPGVGLNGEDAYIEGTLEVDGLTQLDGALTVVGTISPFGSIVGDGGGNIYGMLNPVLNNTAGTTLTISGSLTNNTNSGASGAIIINLPEASTAIGMSYIFTVITAQNFDINPDDADTILGLTNATGDAIRSATIGDSITLMAMDATNWVVTASSDVANNVCAFVDVN